MAYSNKPPFDVPPGAVAKVSIIDSTLRFSKIKANDITKPAVEGFDELPTFPTWSFLVESPSGRKALFDLGAHKELGRYIPRVEDHIKRLGWQLEIQEDVADILRNHGVDPKDIESVIWR